MRKTNYIETHTDKKNKPLKTTKIHLIHTIKQT